MVKVLEEINEEFRRQMNIFTRFKHEHFAKLIGLCEEAKPYYMILEYTDWVIIYAHFNFNDGRRSLKSKQYSALHALYSFLVGKSGNMALLFSKEATKMF